MSKCNIEDLLYEIIEKGDKLLDHLGLGDKKYPRTPGDPVTMFVERHKKYYKPVTK